MSAITFQIRNCGVWRRWYAKVFSVALVLFALPMAAIAQFDYITNNGTITITGYTGYEEAVTIPSTINGLPVTRIGNRAFYYYYSVTNVTIPDSVTSIGEYAFFGSGLTGATIPSSVTDIDYFAYSGCDSLTTITVDALNPVYSSISGVLFNKSQKLLIQFPGGGDQGAVPKRPRQN